MRFALLLSVVATISGCAGPSVQYELLPTASIVGDLRKQVSANAERATRYMSDGVRRSKAAKENTRALEAASIDVFRDGMNPTKSVIFFSKVWSWSNANLTKESFEKKVINQSKKLGADVVVFVERNSSVSGTVTENLPSLGAAISSTVYTVTYGAYAGVYSRSAAGFVSDRQGVISFVYAGSPAEGAGLQEGDKILSVNGVYYQQDPYVIDREIKIKEPGSNVTIQYLNRNMEKRTVVVTLAAQ